MASGKETPRQKMIGLMYLVLMALLAMNVSKDVLNAFITVNSSLLKTNENASIQNEALFNDIKNAYAFDSKKTARQMKSAEEIRKQTSQLLSNIKLIKSEVLSLTENIPTEVADTVQMKNINNKDNYDVPTYFMVGDKEDGSAGKARVLHKLIDDYTASILNLFDEKERLNLNLGLNLEGGIQDNVEMNWETFTFDHAPLVATITLLSKLENDVRNAEYTALSKLYSSIGKDDFPFDTIAAKVVAPSNYILLGEQYKADVFLAAFSTTQNPEIKLNEENLEVSNGVGNYTVKTDKEGLFTYNGEISVKKKNGEIKNYPFESNYLVARPSLTVSPSKMNVLYKGIINPISVSVPGVPNEKITVSCSGGTLNKTGNGTFSIKPSNSGNSKTATVNVYATMEDGSKRSMGSMEFRLKRIPDPKVKIMGKTDNLTFSKAEVTRMNLVNVVYGEDFMFDGNAEILSYNVEVPGKNAGPPQIEKITGNRLTGRAKNLIGNVYSGTIINITNIQVRGMDGSKRKIADVAIRIK